MLLLILLFTLLAHVMADYPYIIRATNAIIGTCQSDSDCLFFSEIYPTLNISQVFCNPVITRCQDASGNVLDPTKQVFCPDISLSYVAYPAMTTTAIAGALNFVDGMLVINVTSSDASYNGFLRLYLSSAVSANFTLSAGFISEQFVNAPTKTFYFRGLVPATYRVQYFDQSGCFEKLSTLVISRADDGSYIPLSYSYDSESGLISYYASYTVDPVTARGARMKLDSPWSAGFIRGGTFVSASIGHRVPFVHVKDMGGAIIDTVVGADLLVSGGVGGATFPIRCQTASLYASVLEATRTSGFVSFQMGMGFATRACSTCPLTFISDPATGNYEGYMAFPSVLDLSAINGAGYTNIDPYNVSQMFFRLNGIYSNTQFMFIDTLQLTSYANLSTRPQITMIDPSYVSPDTGVPQTESVNYFCKRRANESAAYMYIYLDYSDFPFDGNSPYLELQKVTSNSTNKRLVMNPMVPPQRFVILSGIYSLVVYEPGFYCALITENFFDGRYDRVTLQTCFQVSRASASLIQISTDYSSTPQPLHNTTTAYGGVESNVTATFAAILPTTIVLHKGLEMRITINRYSTDPTLNQLLLYYGADQVNIFNDQMGSLNMGLYYVVNNYGDFYLYTLNINPYHEDLYFTTYRIGASTVVDETSSVDLIIFNTTYIIDPNDNSSLPSTLVYGAQQYGCQNLVPIILLQSTSLRTRIVVEDSVCPGTAAAMYAYTEGDFPMHLLDPYSPTYNPALDVLSYYNIWRNVDPLSVGYGNVLLEGLNSVLYGAPPGVLIQLESMDANGMVAVARATADSIVDSSFTVITFLPQRPVCFANNFSQAVAIEYTVNNNVAGSIEYYKPFNAEAIESYDPNAPLFNIPEDCALLYQMDKWQVFLMCNVQSTDTPPANCTGCTRLPVELEKANSDPINNPRLLVTSSTSPEKWEAVVWTPTNVTNPDMPNRTIYCRTTSTITARVPQKLQLIASSPVRLPCFAADCFYASLSVVVDPFFTATYGAQAGFLADPTMTFYSAPSNYRIQMGVTYNVTLFVASITPSFCPVDLTYTATSKGPVFVLVRTTQPICKEEGSGRTSIRMRYNNPSTDTSVSGTSAKLCFYWPNRRGPSFAAADELPFSFDAPVNQPATTLLPYTAAFGFDAQFTDIVAGVHQMMMYDRCNDNGCTSCKSTLPSSFTLTDSTKTFAYKTFTIDTSTQDTGGIVVQLTDYQEPTCHGVGNKYKWNFTVYDNAGDGAGIGYPPYEILFKKPFTNEVYKSYGGCIVTQNNSLPTPTPYGDYQVKIGDFYFEVDSGLEGIGSSGNYTLIVRSCQNFCVKTFATYVDFVEPFFVHLSSGGADCAYNQAVLISTVIGGTPFKKGENGTQTISIPGSNITYTQRYTYCWITPFNPLGPCIETFLPSSVYAGFYQLTITDRNGCNTTANITVGSLGAITITSITSNAVCQSTNNATVTFNVTGGSGTYYIIEKVAQLQTGQTVSAEFVATFNQTVLFHVMDSNNCINPVEVSFRLSDPGPVPLNVSVIDSCANTPTGEIHVTSPERITCTWAAAGITVPELQTCTLKNILPNVFLLLTATTDIGCVGTQQITVGIKPLIVITQVERTTVGFFDECVDNITLSISGGEYGPPYRVLFVSNPTSNVTVMESGTFSDGNGTVFVSGVCRSYNYRFRATELDASCSSSEYSSTDPEFSFGSGLAKINGFPVISKARTKPCASTTPKGEPYGRYSWVSVWMPLVMLAVILFIGGIMILVQTAQTAAMEKKVNKKINK